MKFEGLFNYHGEITRLYRHGNTEKQAITFMHQQLAEKYGVTVARIRQYFNGKSDNYHIKKM